jgi:hypothetical protein
MILLFPLLLAACTEPSALPLDPVTVHLELDKTTVTAGTPIKGTAIFNNTTSKVITFPHYCSNEWLQVGLDGKHYRYPNWSLLVICKPALPLRRGQSKFPFTISTKYRVCIQTRVGGEGTGGPPCVGVNDGEPPSLPPGTYTTRSFVEGAGVSAAPRIRVTLLPASFDGSPATSPAG